MTPPMVSLITWNRLGLTARNLKALLETDEDFELYLADNGSRDGTWDYLSSLSDPRIRGKVRFDANHGPVYAGNYHLARRRKGQYFITVDSDVNIHSTDWISKFMEVFREFPSVGLLGAVTKEYICSCRQPMILHQRGPACFLEITKGFVEGCCQCLHPELIERIGYWNEECCTGDMELSYRVLNHTPFKAGFQPSIEIDQLQYISCDSCTAVEFCNSCTAIEFCNNFEKSENGFGCESKRGRCFLIHERNYMNPQFRNNFRYKYLKFIRELEDGSRGASCGSIHDEASMVLNRYDPRSASENFRYYETQSSGS